MLLTTPQAAREIGVSRQYAFALIRLGLLPARRVGRGYVIARADLARFKRKRARQRATITEN